MQDTNYRLWLASALFPLIVGYFLGVSAQSVGAEKPKIKNFGASLKKFDRKNISESSGNEATSSFDDTIKINVNLVVNSVLVLDRQGNSVAGLKQNDFLVTDNGSPQEISVFSYGENASVPRSFVLIMDYSGSMDRYLDTSIAAAGQLVDKLGPQDIMAVVTDDIKLLVDFTNDKNLIKKKLRSLFIEAKSGDAKSGYSRDHSLQYSALLATLRELFDDEDLVPIVIFQTDGDELRIMKPAMGGYKHLEKKFGFSDVLEAVERSRATIYSIIPGFRFIGVSEQLYEQNSKSISKQYSGGSVSDKLIALIASEQGALSQVSQLSGGYTGFIEKPEDAERVYSKLLEDTNKRYLIGYYPYKVENGKRHTLRVEVRGHPEYVVLGRKKYVAA